MNRSDIEWSFVLRHTRVPAVTMLVAAVLLVASYWINARHERMFEAVTANQAAMHEDHVSLVDQRRVIDTYHRRYEAFGALGFVGHEDRLNWVETLRTTTAGLDLPRVAYAIEPQHTVIPPVTSALGDADIQINVSRLQLELGLLHELDLLRFFDALQAQAPGFIKVDQCELTFEAQQASLLADVNITANCEVQIYSAVTSDVIAEASL